MKKILYFLFFHLLFAVVINAIEPYSIITTNNFITSIMIHDNTIFVSTSNGTIEIYDIHTKKKQGDIQLAQISDYFGNKIPPKIFQTHTIDGENILIVSQDSNGSSKLFIYNGRTTTPIQITSNHSIIKKAYFIDNNTIVLGFLSNEIWAYDIVKNEILWSVKPSDAVFSDLIIAKDIVLSTTEGGIIYLIDIKNGTIISQLQGANFDNIHMLASANDIILSAGTDKTCGIYHKSGKFMRLKTNFIVYAVAISQDSKLGAVSFNENNDILVFSTTSLQHIAMLSGGDALPNSIIFIDNQTIVASFDSKSILFWKLKED